MEYEPQTLSSDEMMERLELFETEFFALAKVMNIITSNTDAILDELDKRINSLEAPLPSVTS
jgi:hypothetical protein